MSISIYSNEKCEKIAKEARLRYVKNIPGISRVLENKQFVYYYPNGKKVNEEEILVYIKSLAIPPAYHDVWICPFKNGHILATGRDARNRKQYRYHPLWNQVRDEQKFHLMLDFGEALHNIRAHIDKELKKEGDLNKNQIICAVIYLMDISGVRIGNSIYAKENKTYGLTTLRKKHLQIQDNKAVLQFAGKGLKIWEIILKNKKIIKILKKCEAIPGYELFKYFDEDNNINTITSQDVNEYLKSLTNHPFTAKNFRTWTACRETLSRLLKQQQIEEEYLKLIILEVAKKLGHTPAICLKNYIYPEIILDWKTKRLFQWFNSKKKELIALSEDDILLCWLKNRCILDNSPT